MTPFRSKPEPKRAAMRPLPFLLLMAALTVLTVLPFRSVVNEMARDSARKVPYASILPHWDGKSFKVGLVDSAATRDFYQRDAATTGAERIPRAWRRFLATEKIDYQVFNTIPAAEAHDCQVLVLPSVICVSDDELVAVRSNMERGVGLIFTWAFGSRDTKGLWRPVSGLQVHAGLAVQGDVPEVFPAESHCEVISLPWITDSVPAGQSLLLPRSSTPLRAVKIEPRNQVVAQWVRRSGRARGEKEPDGAAMITGKHGESRYFWMGFNLGETLDRDPDSLALRDLMRQVVFWTSRAPQVSKPPFPEGISGATWTGVNLRRMEPGVPMGHSAFENEKLRPTWFVDVSWIGSEANMRRLAAVGEVALLSENGQADGWSLTEMRSFRQRLSQVVGYDVEGIRIEGPLLDATIDRLSGAGFRYVVTQDVESSLPRLVRQKRVIPLFSRPRYLWLVPDAGLFEHLSPIGRLTGNLYEWSDQPEESSLSLDDESRLTGVLRQIRKRWESWLALKASIKQSGGSGPVLTFSNTGYTHEYNVRFVFKLPSDSVPHLFSSTLHSPELVPTPSGPGIWEVRFKKLAAGRNHAYRLTY